MPALGLGMRVAFIRRLLPAGEAGPVYVHNDDFKRADQNLSDDPRYKAPLVGQPSNIAIVSGVVKTLVSECFVPLAATMPDNFAVEIDIPLSTSASNSFFAVRAQGSNPAGNYLGIRVRPGGGADVYNQWNNGFQSIGSTSNFSGGETARFEIIGQEVRVYKATKESLTRLLVTTNVRAELAAGGIAAVHGRATGQSFLAGLRIEAITAFSA